MSDLNWCTFCDNAISAFSKSLYCSDHCLRADALRNHPLLGYTYPECIHFARRSNTKSHIFHAPPELVTINHQPFTLSDHHIIPSSPKANRLFPSPISKINTFDNNSIHLSSTKSKYQQEPSINNASKLVRLYAN